MMLEVLDRFPALGMRDLTISPIENYQALPPGEKAIYNQYILLKLENEAKSPALKFDFSKKGG